jgi:hypothetical protein
MLSIRTAKSTLLVLVLLFGSPALGESKLYQPGYYGLKPTGELADEKLELPANILKATEGKPIPNEQALAMMAFVLRYANTANVILKIDKSGIISAIPHVPEIDKSQVIAALPTSTVADYLLKSKQKKLLTIFLDRSFAAISHKQMLEMANKLKNSVSSSGFQRILIIEDRSDDCIVVVDDFNCAQQI